MKNISRGRTWAVIGGSVALVAGVSMARIAATGMGHDNDRGRRSCSVATLRGDYGIQLQGTRPSAPGAAIESVIGVVLRTYDGRGQFTQIDNVKGSISGITPNRFGSGTYAVNADCTGLITAMPGPDILLEEQIVIVDDANEVRSIVVSPQPVMVTGLQRRLDPR